MATSGLEAFRPSGGDVASWSLLDRLGVLTWGRAAT